MEKRKTDDQADEPKYEKAIIPSEFLLNSKTDPEASGNRDEADTEKGR